MSSARTAKPPAPATGRRSSTMTQVAWVVNREMDLADWISAGRNLGTVGRCSNWWLGDWIRYGNARFGERYARAATITGYDAQSLMNMVWVATQFEVSRRREGLSWSHHESVASLAPDEQERWLDRAFESRLSVADLRLELRTARKSAVVGEAGAEDLDLAADGVLVCPNCGGRVTLAEYQKQLR